LQGVAQLTVAGIVFHFLVFLLYCWSLKVVEVSEVASISSEKVALTSVERATPVAPLSGSKLSSLSSTVGLTVSGRGATVVRRWARLGGALVHIVR